MQKIHFKTYDINITQKRYEIKISQNNINFIIFYVLESLFYNAPYVRASTLVGGY